MVSRRTNFGERSEPAPDRGGKLQSAGGGGGRHKVTFRHCTQLNSKESTKHHFQNCKPQND